MILRDMTESDLDVLFDIQDDDIAQHMAGFTSPAGGDRDNYVARQRRFLADDRITNKVILVDDEIAGSIASFVVEGDAEVTYWIRRDLWGRGIATTALGELLREVTVRRLFARAAADNAGSAKVLLRNGFTRVGEETSYASRTRRGDHGAHLPARRSFHCRVTFGTREASTLSSPGWDGPLRRGRQPSSPRARAPN